LLQFEHLQGIRFAMKFAMKIAQLDWILINDKQKEKTA
jgi:hypothetical protein